LPHAISEAKVRCYDVRLSAGLADFAGDRLENIRAPRGNNDIVAVTGEQERELAPYTRGRAGDECNHALILACPERAKRVEGSRVIYLAGNPLLRIRMICSTDGESLSISLTRRT